LSLTQNRWVFAYRPPAQLVKSTSAAKVTFAEFPTDSGQDKENDQPAVADKPMAEIEDKSPVQTQPQQQMYSNAKNVESDDGEAKIIPWRAQLRKTNSTLNLLE